MIRESFMMNRPHYQLQAFPEEVKSKLNGKVSRFRLEDLASLVREIDEQSNTPHTLRQLYYAVLGAGYYPSKEPKSYDTFIRMMKLCRLHGLTPWGRVWENMMPRKEWNKRVLIQSEIGLDVFYVVVLESAGMYEQISYITEAASIPIVVSPAQMSLEMVYAIYDAFLQAKNAHKIRIIYLRDHAESAAARERNLFDQLIDFLFTGERADKAIGANEKQLLQNHRPDLEEGENGIFLVEDGKPWKKYLFMSEGEARRASFIRNHSYEVMWPDPKEYAERLKLVKRPGKIAPAEYELECLPPDFLIDALINVITRTGLV